MKWKNTTWEILNGQDKEDYFDRENDGHIQALEDGGDTNILHHLAIYHFSQSVRNVNCDGYELTVIVNTYI